MLESGCCRVSVGGWVLESVLERECWRVSVGE